MKNLKETQGTTPKLPSPPSKQLMEDIKARGTLGFNFLEMDNLYEYLKMVMKERGDKHGPSSFTKEKDGG